MAGARFIPLTVAGLFLCVVTGCAGGLAGDEARQAERAGQYHRAYELYCRAAEVNRGSRLLGMSIARVAPQAAIYWEDQAHRAVDRGDHVRAWQLFMRVLEIRPDHPSAPHLIRRLERKHAEELSTVRTAWLRRGSPALEWPAGRLAMGDRREPEQESGAVGKSGAGPVGGSGRVEPRRADRRGPRHADRSEPAEGLRPVSEPVGGTARAERNHQTVPTRRAPLAAGTAGMHPVGRLAEGDRIPDAAGRAIPARAGGTGETDAGRPGETRRRGAPAGRGAASETRVGRPSVTSRSAPGGLGGWPRRSVGRVEAGSDALRRPTRSGRQALRPTPMQRGGIRGAASQPVVRATGAGTNRSSPVWSGRSRTTAGTGSPFQFLVVRTLSKKDRRFPKKAEVIDGLIIEVRDTDDDPDADFNVYLGRKRIAKYKGKELGEACPVAGRSGRRYEVVLLSIVDKRGTIRFGIRAARGGGVH